MKSTGIIRRIDDLGRIVIPKEICRTMSINDGDPFEIYTDSNGSIILRPYSESWEDCVLKWYNVHITMFSNHNIEFSEIGNFTICVYYKDRIGVAKYNGKDTKDYRIGMTIAYFHAMGYDNAKIDSTIGYIR